jgi:hypothetical protein
VFSLERKSIFQGNKTVPPAAKLILKQAKKFFRQRPEFVRGSRLSQRQKGAFFANSRVAIFQIFFK